MIKTLIVDDEEWNRDLIKRFGNWEAYGMELIGEAENGLEAIQIIERLKPDVVITDMRMPGMDGVELLQQINDRFGEIKIIVISGYDDFVYTKQAILAQAKDYLLKPINPTELNEVLLKCKREIDSLSNSQELFGLDIELMKIVKNVMPSLALNFADLNTEKIQDIFHQLVNQLEDYRSLLAFELERIYQEYMFLLNELMAKNLYDGTPISYVKTHFPSCLLMIQDLTGKYISTMEALIVQRKNKNKLNLSDIRAYIENNFTRAITVEKIAQVFFVSYVYLSRSFKSEFGLNITDYIQQLRMDKAKEWIVIDQIPIKVVAEMCGYEDVAYFYKVFKKYFGIAPGEMRKEQE
ncbi:response regulator [Paenibacillus frigoriresistens]|uniref:response regulator transcription factor n=1 Tax=Paenibacillus alginolyticus TaxID=59839 RepID=UPI0015672897|nr:response regulator [Paenibacillus frigoriresistens]NRF93777.1 response regulator [Paenibacillus frigoriresistens]